MLAYVEHKKKLSHTHIHTDARTHFDVGTGTVGLPSLQALGGGRGASLLLSHIFQGGIENYGGVELRGMGGCSFLRLTGGFILDYLDVRLTNCNFKLQCAMQCSIVLWCVVVSLGVKWCGVLCCSLLWCVICYRVLCCVVAWCVVLWSHEERCSVLRCHVVWSGVTCCGLMSCGVVCCGVM